jgi:hypothetical protein
VQLSSFESTTRVAFDRLHRGGMRATAAAAGYYQQHAISALKEKMAQMKKKMQQQHSFHEKAFSLLRRVLRWDHKNRLLFGRFF